MPQLPQLNAEFKYASKSDIDAAGSVAASLPLESASASALAFSLNVLWMHKKVGHLRYIQYIKRAKLKLQTHYYVTKGVSKLRRS